MRTRMVIGLALVALGASTNAQAATIVGQSPPVGLTPAGGCSANFERLNTGVASGNSYVIPVPGGVVTRWQTQGDPGDAGRTIAMRVYTQQDATHFTPVFDTGARSLTVGVLNTFTTRFPVSGGEIIGVRADPTGTSDCGYDSGGPADTQAAHGPPGAIGTSALFTTNSGFRIDVAAIVEPDGDRDGFGDESQDGCPSDATKQTDCVVPSALLAKHPKQKSKSATATFKFSSDDPGATFQCAIDKKALSPCGSPKKFKKLKTRKHKFQLVATDVAGNASAPTVFRWRVVG